MSTILRLAGMAGLLGLAACAATPGEDYGIDSKKLNTLRADIWVDPNGCHHWVIDDGAEGYMTARLNRDGRPVCPGVSSQRDGTAGLPAYRQQVTLWTDPRGCQHWVSDHGAGGYMSQRLARDGRPVCPGAAQPAPAERVTLGADALFDTNKADLRPRAIAALDAFGARMQELGKRRVFITGHTDSRGAEAYNTALSERRADAVADYLRAQYGITTQTEGRGEAEPVADNTTKAGRQANRRVEITVLD